MRVSGEKLALVQVASAPQGQRGYLVGALDPVASTRPIYRASERGPYDPLDHRGNFLASQPLADSIGHANLEMVEPLALVDMRKGNAAAPR
jgi:hypothetical protein